MTNQDIDRRLALAIGYANWRVRVAYFGIGQIALVQVFNDDTRCDGPMQYNNWQRFDHTDMAVIWPIAERFECFPFKTIGAKWNAMIWPKEIDESSEYVKAIDTHPATATALAVIRFVESGK